MTLVEQLADSLGMYPEDVAGFAAARWGTDPAADLPKELAIEVRAELDSDHCIRSVPAVWWPGSDPDAGRAATKMR